MVYPINVKTGDVYGMFTVIKEVDNINKKRCFIVKCKCGTEKILPLIKFRSGKTKSCGCLRRQTGNKASGFRHGNTAGGKVTPSYSSWRNMKHRCNSNKHINSNRYKQRGINYCKEWESFENFLADMGEPPTEFHSLDRIDNDGNYEPSNCRWANQKEQVRNSTTAKFITHKGITKSVVEWAEYFCVNYDNFRGRISRGYTVEEAIKPESKMKNKKNHLITYKGKTQNITGWAKEIGVTRDTLYNRVRRGWTIERMLS